MGYLAAPLVRIVFHSGGQCLSCAGGRHRWQSTEATRLLAHADVKAAGVSLGVGPSRDMACGGQTCLSWPRGAAFAQLSSIIDGSLLALRICRGPDRIVADHPDIDSIGGMAGWLKSRDKTNSSRWCLQPRERYDLLITNICWEIEKGWRKARCLKALS